MATSLLRTTIYGFRSFSSSANRMAIKKVTVIGAGLMGSGIAQIAAQTKHEVTLVDVSKQVLDEAIKRIEKSLKRIAHKNNPNDIMGNEIFVDDALGKIKLNTSATDAVKYKKADIVIEAIVENLQIKQDLFQQLDQVADLTTMFASNTSSLPITDIFKNLDKRRERCGGLHFFNPVPVMKLLEVVKTDDMSQDAYENFMEFGKNLGKTTITCRDTPGFVVNRLLVPYMSEAVKMLERGDATAKDIDIAMKLGAGYPMGPFELLDYVGLDTTKFIMDGWQKKFAGNPLFETSELLSKLVKEGKLGVKSGEGFYKYNKNKEV